jgi:serine/threonine protein kinase
MDQFPEMATPLSPTGTHPPSSPDPEKTERHWRHRFSLSKLMGKNEQPPCEPESKQQPEPVGKPSLGRRISRRVVPGLPRPATFRRQQSERREKLTPVEPTNNGRRPVSVDRRRESTPRPKPAGHLLTKQASAPTVCSVENKDDTPPIPQPLQNGTLPTSDQPHLPHPAPPPSPPPDNLPNTLPEIPPETDMSEASFNDDIDEQIKTELEEKWILNLSMHFRDKSPREKFFVTYAETPTRWRRVTISCDYRDAPPDSLERDLQSLQYQREKSARIYEAIRMSLPEIQFYDTVTNLKLETSQDDRLHVHVTEDVNEIIPYPSTNAVQHIEARHVPESDVKFESHMSGFVYKVRVHGQTCIKKEIPGPDSVEEFLYEINALHALKGSQNVIQFLGLVIDETNNLVKGLLISYAEKGPLVDLIFDHKGSLEWERRERWAKQIVRGLSEIHEAGFVQGDFTLSNIVIDEHDRAQIIDINRRGCPVGWEPPEIAKLIKSSQRIAMYIGVKSDLFQLGMVLWALAEEEDEPERQPQPLSLAKTRKEIPQYFRDLTDRCLSVNTRDRPAARDLLALFPNLETDHPTPPPSLPQPSPRPDEFAFPSEITYLDFAGLGAVHEEGHHSMDRRDSIEIPFDGPGSYIVSRHGYSPSGSRAGQAYSSSNHYSYPSRPPSELDEPQIVTVSPGGDNRWEEINIDGRGYLVQRSSIELERGRSRLRTGSLGHGMGIEHVDSGLADMDLTGVGGHENLRGYEGFGGRGSREILLEEDCEPEDRGRAEERDPAREPVQQQENQ